MPLAIAHRQFAVTVEFLPLVFMARQNAHHRFPGIAKAAHRGTQLQVFGPRRPHGGTRPIAWRQLGE